MVITCNIHYKTFPFYQYSLFYGVLLSLLLKMKYIQMMGRQ